MEHREHIDMIPSHMRDAITLYIEQGVPAGGFLTAVLENDLRNAAGRGDDENQRALVRWVQYLYSYAPSGCWGSPEKVVAWIAKGGLGQTREDDDDGELWMRRIGGETREPEGYY